MSPLSLISSTSPAYAQAHLAGQCLQAFSNGKIPYCVKFHPDKQNVFLAGMSDKKIIQYDMNSGEITQEYDQHLGPVSFSRSSFLWAS